jgi:hypothetical protein
MFDSTHRRGFDLVIATNELRDRLLRRADFHAKRATFYSGKAKEFEEDVEAIPRGYENSTLGRHEDQLVRSRVGHLQAETKLRFYADHLPKQETVILTDLDISEMELLMPVEA